MAKSLSYCPVCKEKSVVVKIYVREKDGKRKRVEHCINKGCTYRMDLPFPEELKGGDRG